MEQKLTARSEQMIDGAIDPRAVWITEDLKIVTGSHWIARYYGKEHRHVLRDIRALIEQGVCPNLGTPHIVESQVTNPQNGQLYPCFLLDYEAFDLLVGSYTGEARSITPKLKARFREMEQQLAYRRLLSDPRHLMEITKMYCEQAEKVKELTEANRIQAERITHDVPLVSYAESIKSCSTDVSMATFAETVGLRLKDCHDWFMKKGLIIHLTNNEEQGYRVSAKGRMFKPQLLKTIQTPLKTGRIALSVQITPKGQARFHEMIMKEKEEEVLL